MRRVSAACVRVSAAVGGWVWMWVYVWVWELAVLETLC
jgi:hypothetical protein